MAKTQKPGTEQESMQDAPKKWEDYQETILVRNPASGEIDAVRDLKQVGNKYEVHTTQPLTKNAPSFFELKDSSAVAAFIRSFKSQKDKPIDFQFLKVPYNAVQEVITSLLRLNQDPEDSQGKETLGKYYLDTAKLQRVKFDHAEIPRSEMKELGIDFDALSPTTQEQMRLGLPVKELVPTTIQVSDSVTMTGEFAPRFYRDHNNELKVALDAPLARPEYESENYEMMFSTQEKAQMERGATLERLVQHKDAITGREEWCYVGFNSTTNRLAFQPKKEVETPSFTYRARISDQGQEELKKGGSAMVEGCHYNNSDNYFTGKISYDIHRGEYITIPLKYEHPYIPKNIREQLSDKEYQALCSYEKVDGEHIQSRNGKYFKGCDLQVNRETNILGYQRRELSLSKEQSKEQNEQQRQSRGVSR